MTTNAERLTRLAEEFWGWRDATCPDSHDDLNRVERPDGWRPDWSAAAVQARRGVLDGFARRLGEIDLSGEPTSTLVDGRLLGCALARVRWELEVLRGWERNPCFYLDQALIPGYEELLAPPPFGPDRAQRILDWLRCAPAVLAQARENLPGHAAAPFARQALRLLSAAGDQVRAAMTALSPLLPAAQAAELPAAVEAAVDSLVSYQDWLTAELPEMSTETAVGPAALSVLLHQVALLPHTAAELSEMGRRERDRAIGWEAVLRARCRNASPPNAYPDLVQQVARQERDERDIRQFLEAHSLLSQPPDLRRYRFAPMPDYLKPLTWLGVSDYLASAGTADQDAVRYVVEPAPGLPYFQAAKALDPRTGIAHEGVHAQQLALSWQHANPARRRFYDSAPNEGIAFYHEEMLIQTGLFDDSPASARFLVNSLRLRALRVEVDIALALGETSVEAAARSLAEEVPMDLDTALQEALFFAGNPGQGMSYLVGKTQILRLLADCARRDGFDLRSFHDRLWLEGNVPLALQRWEVLGDNADVITADKLAVTTG